MPLTSGRSMPLKGLLVPMGLVTVLKRTAISAEGLDVVCRHVSRRVILADTETMHPIQPCVVSGRRRT